MISGTWLWLWEEAASQKKGSLKGADLRPQSQGVRDQLEIALQPPITREKYIFPDQMWVVAGGFWQSTWNRLLKLNKNKNKNKTAAKLQEKKKHKLDTETVSHITSE